LFGGGVGCEAEICAHEWLARPYMGGSGRGCGSGGDGGRVWWWRSAAGRNSAWTTYLQKCHRRRRCPGSAARAFAPGPWGCMQP
jgi:hypothetical protein